ncbi:MAG: MBL fold metallo-hydrolase [Flectobacillus sp.]|nr:MBL fold metallo-hydrolase [Flectobacillus sp.]
MKLVIDAVKRVSEMIDFRAKFVKKTKMKKTILILLGLTFNLSFGLKAQDALQLFPKGDRASSDYFIGTAYINVLSPADTIFNTQIGNVTFEAGARTFWHSHEGGQILLVTDGIGYYQERGKVKQIIRKGDIIKCLPNVSHWHGASSETAMTHIALNTNTQKKIVMWLDAVTDYEYIHGKKYQAVAPKPQPFGNEAFEKIKQTIVKWTGNAGFLINARGTTLMVDPLLKDFDMPVLFDYPIAPKDVPHLDAVLISHSDNDHFSIPTNKDLAPNTNAFHSTVYVDSLMKNLGWKSFGHDIGETFKVGKNVKVKLSPADHQWQNAYKGVAKRFFKKEDCTGFLIETPDGTIWAQGDSKLMPEHLTMTPPDAILFDFSDSEWHFTLAGAVEIANAYPNTPLLLSHWGTVDSPDFAPFNGDPEKLKKLIKNPSRIVVLAPGESYVLKKLKK